MIVLWTQSTRMVGSAEQGKEWQDGQAVTGVLYKTSDDQEHVATANLTVVCDGMHPRPQDPLPFCGSEAEGLQPAILQLWACGVSQPLPPAVLPHQLH